MYTLGIAWKMAARADKLPKDPALKRNGSTLAMRGTQAAEAESERIRGVPVE